MRRARSLRSTLLIWNASVVVGLLALFGAGLSATIQFRLRSELDDDLRNQGDRGARSGPPPEDRPRPLGQRDGRIPDAFRPLYADAERASDIRRPRFYFTEQLPDRHPPDDPLGLGGPPDDLPDRRRDRPLRQDQMVDPEGQREGMKGPGVFRTITYEGIHVRTYSRPIFHDGRTVGVVQTAREMDVIEDLGRIQAGTLLLCLPLAALAAAGAAITLANRALNPVASVTRTAASIGSRDLAQRLDVPGEDELAELARTFNGMLGRLQTAFAELGDANQRLSQTLEAQRRFTADASHELRTPLTRLRLAAGVVRKEDADIAELREALAVADRAGGVMTRLVEQLLTLARVDAGQLPMRKEKVDLRIVVADALDTVTAVDRVDAEFPDRVIPQHVDPDHIRRVVINLLENALRHTPEPGRVRLNLTDDGRFTQITVEDDGVGIAPEHLERVFERFYRVDDARDRDAGGSGLGLAICRDLVRAHGGEIRLESRVGRGTRAVVTLPHSTGPNPAALTGRSR